MEHLGKGIDCTTSDRDIQQGMLTLSIGPTLPVGMSPMVGTSWHQLWSVAVCGTPREGGRLHYQRSWCPTGDAYTIYTNITCRDDPHGRYIMTSAMVCKSVWNTSGRGSTALPAIVMSDRGCSHSATSCVKGMQKNISFWSQYQFQCKSFCKGSKSKPNTFWYKNKGLDFYIHDIINSSSTQCHINHGHNTLYTSDL